MDIVLSPRSVKVPDNSLIIAISPGDLRVFGVAVIITAFLAPNLVWILLDRSVWQWDQANYGTATLGLAHAHGFKSWASSMLMALGMAPPLLPWAAQIFVPVRHITGDFESAMLLVNIIFIAGTAILIYKTCIRLGSGRTVALTATLLAVGSGLVIGLSHQYLVESSQTFSAAALIALSWRIERQSWLRCTAFLFLAVAVAQASKASSFIFVIPLLTYDAVVLGLTWRKERPNSTTVDVALLIFSIACFLFCASWYWINWQPMIAHFAAATIADSTLFWGHPVDLAQKIRFWLTHLSRGISSIQVLSIMVLVVCLVALALGTQRCLRRKFATASSIENGTLFAAVLAITIVMTMFAFCLQINEDTRFLAGLVPFVAVLFGWSLSVLRLRWLSLVLLAALGANALLNNALAFGFNPFGVTPYNYIIPLSNSYADRARLSALVNQTCTPEAKGGWVILGINYSSLNGNSANFFAAKDVSARGQCRYANFPLFEGNLNKILAFVDASQAAYIVTMEPSALRAPDGVNILAKPFAEHLAATKRFSRIGEVGDVLIYRRELPR